jgi:hypothetical protein
MQQWMRTRALRTVGLLFGLSLMLMACGDVGGLPGAIGGELPPASEESEPEDVTDESEPEEEESEVSEGSEPVEEEEGHDEERCRDRNHDHDDEGDDAEQEDAAQSA